MRKLLNYIEQNKMIALALVVICFIPAIYAAVFLKGMWDPYNHLDQIPVAVVNEDEGAQDQSGTVKIGNQVVQQLKDNKTFKWEFVDDDSATNGLRDAKYYMTITIPKDFTKNALSALSTDAKPAVLTYKTNAALSLPIETASSSAMEHIKESIQANITTTIVNKFTALAATGNPTARALIKNPNLGKNISQAVELKHEQYTRYDNYGNGLAPYFMSVAIFVGCMLFCFILPLKVTGNRWKWLASRVAIGSIAAIAMAVIIGLSIQGVGLHVDNIGHYYTTLTIYALAIMFICMALATAIGYVGRFISMLLLVFSLGASGGTFPILTSSSFYQTIHHFVPITYSLNGLRSSIAGGIPTATVHGSWWTLAIVAIASVAVLAGAVALQKPARKDD